MKHHEIEHHQNFKQQGAFILGTYIDALTYDSAISTISAWANRHESRYVSICNVHSVVTAQGDHGFGKVIREADIAAPDGMPVAWMLRALGFPRQERISGPDLLWRLCGLLPKKKISVYFYGGSERTLKKLDKRLSAAFPDLQIAGIVSPPYRELSEDEDEAHVRAMNDSGAGVVFVGLGCPKQERWMANHKGRINAVMIGVGAAFDYHAGTLARAPIWMRNCGLEWLFRLASEPRRLWKRYFVTNSLFILGAIRQLLLHGR